MFGKNIIQAILSGIGNYWFEGSISIVLVLTGWVGGFFRARRQWKQREFLERLNISLNMLQDGKLLIRTLAEQPLDVVFPNMTAIQTLQQASKLTTETNPIPPLGKEDFWPILNCVLNVISEKFSDGYLRRDLGYPVKTAPYLMCLTRERSAVMRTSKIRAMVMKKSLLLNLPEKEPIYEQPSHRVRFQTLQQLAALYQRNPEQFVEIEFSL
jgi:hypothetical protein